MRLTKQRFRRPPQAGVRVGEVLPPRVVVEDTDVSDEVAFRDRAGVSVLAIHLVREVLPTHFVEFAVGADVGDEPTQAIPKYPE